MRCRYKHGVIQELLDPSLLRDVRNEIQANISFTPKETDIYKIYQSGDLANLDGLDESSLKLLPSLVKLRDALYSSPFREYLSHVTGAGALSGIKTDMAVNVYNPTCHLLCHDDVIGSRRVSYILYLTDPDRPWKAEWGGALRLYSTNTIEEGDGSVIKVPDPHPTTTIPPAFNQLSFFAVQPGESFHDVEEVYTTNGRENSYLQNSGRSGYTKEEKDYLRAKGEMNTEDTEDEGGRVRMAISGWFHIPQPGEEGFEEGAQEKQAAKSSLAQLQGNADKYDLPRPHWTPIDNVTPESEDLTEEDLDFLIKFLNPRYLTPDTVEELQERFSEESTLQLASFLSPKYETTLRELLSTHDNKSSAWKVARPPHKHRFLYRQAGEASNDELAPLHQLLNDLFPSTAFCKWLALVTDFMLESCNIIARRFRRGQDYTLATGYEREEPQLEVSLGLTPSTGWGLDDVDDTTSPSRDLNGKTNIRNKEPVGTADSVGGYEMYMAGDEDEDDDNDRDGDDATSDHGVTIPSSHTGAGKRREKADPAIYKASGDEDDDGILFESPASWNMLNIVLRDKNTLKFVKYVSKSANGDRWDISGEWKVQDIENENLEDVDEEGRADDEDDIEDADEEEGDEEEVEDDGGEDGEN